MAALHSALRSLAPCDFAEVPTSSAEQEAYLSKLFSDCEVILESIPIASAEDSQSRPRAQTTSSVASSASEISASSARSAPPSAEFATLQKEWGKALKLSAKENPLGISVYKASGKDGRGSWFARRSVHEGLSFAKFKMGLEREFPDSLAAGGSVPGEGNIRGIGGERKVEDINVQGKGRIQTWQLSAQFPGPTTPRDFVTLLVTSSKAMSDGHHSTIPQIAPRHYMIISKPCNHPETQPRSGYVRGQYESVEFIREVPRKVKHSMSSSDLQHLPHRAHEPKSLEKDLLRRNAAKSASPLKLDARSTDDLLEGKHVEFSPDESHPHRDMSPNSRQRSVTVGVPATTLRGRDDDHPELEDDPVEWIMITRSDPGGSVPRFMVERGTPSSIVADASKFLDWACQKDEPQHEDAEALGPERPPHPGRRESFASWQANGHLAGLDGMAPAPDAVGTSGEGETEAFPDISSSGQGARSAVDSTPPEGSVRAPHHVVAATGILGSVTGVLGAYAPQAVLDHLPASLSTPQNPSTPTLPPAVDDSSPPATGTDDARTLPILPAESATNDAASTTSTVTFASADSHFSSDARDPSPSSISSPTSTRSPQIGQLTPEEKEKANFERRKAALDSKLSVAKEKYAKDVNTQSEKVKKVEEKHRKEVEKEEEKYRKALAKQDEKKAKDARKEEERKRKEMEKDEKSKLTRERDEGRKELAASQQEVALLKKQVDLMASQIGDLQKENTMLVARIGKDTGEGSTGVQKLIDEEKQARSRSSSLRKGADGDGHGEERT